MKNLSFSLIAWAMLLCGCANQQTDYFQAYYPGIYKAEKYILDSLYIDALTTYQATFAQVPFVFGRDYYNATVCAVLTDKHEEAFEFLTKLAEQGATLEWLSKQPIIQPLKSLEKWNEFVAEYPELRKSFSENFNLTLRKELIAMDSIDQCLRLKPNAYSLYRDTINKIDQVNAGRLNEIITEHGFPGERIIGIQDSIAVSYPGDYILVHQAPSTLPYRSPINFDSLIQEARSGRMSPHTLAHYLDRKKEGFIFDQVSLAVCKALVNDSIFMNSPDPETGSRVTAAKYAYIKRTGSVLEAYNLKRALLGLEPYDEFRMKVYRGQVGSLFSFHYTGAVAFYHFNQEKQRQSFMATFSEFEDGARPEILPIRYPDGTLRSKEIK